MLRAGVFAATIALLGGAVWILVQGGSPRREARRGPASEGARVEEPAKRPPKTAKSRALPPGLAELARRPVRPVEIADRGPVEPPKIIDDPGRPRSETEVVSRFEAYMAQLEELEEGPESLSPQERRRLYRESSAMMSALTEQFDLSDPDQRHYLEEARSMMMSQMDRLGVRPPEPEARPHREPEPPPR